MSNDDTIQRIEEKLDDFIKTYEIDMRGDKTVNGGKKGLVEHMREVKKYIEENPSLVWLLRNKTFPTIAIIITVFLLLEILFQVGFFSFLLPALGIDIPLP